MATKYGNALYPVGVGGGGGASEQVNYWQYVGAAGATDTIQMSQNLNEVLPQFTILGAAVLVVGQHNTGAPACDIGYAATDGDTSTINGVKATDLTYWNSAINISAAGRYGVAATNANKPVTLPKDAWPVLTMHTASITGTTLTLSVFSRYDGTP